MHSTEVADAFTRMLHAIDAKDWPGVRYEFADHIDIDYQSLFGAPAARVEADAHVAGWQDFATAFDTTQHITGPFVVTTTNDRATAETHVRAYHQIKGTDGGETWMVAGHYTVRLRLIAAQWKIDGITLTVFYQEGNLNIPNIARSRASASPKLEIGAGDHVTERADIPRTQREDRVRKIRHFFDFLEAKDIPAWSGLWHDQGTILVFYPLDGFPRTIEGRINIVSGFETLFSNFDRFEPRLTGVYPAADSDAVCVEYSVRATLRNGTSYANDNIAVFRFQDGLVRWYHDYFDPRRFQAVVDALPAR
jgi:ketosteroid isomerase-like protein